MNWETGYEWDYDEERETEIKVLELDNYSKGRFRVDRYERYGWTDAEDGEFFQTEIGAISYIENILRQPVGPLRYRIVDLEDKN